MQCNAMQCNAMQYNTIQYNTLLNKIHLTLFKHSHGRALSLFLLSQKDLKMSQNHRVARGRKVPTDYLVHLISYLNLSHLLSPLLLSSNYVFFLLFSSFITFFPYSSLLFSSLLISCLISSCPTLYFILRTYITLIVICYILIYIIPNFFLSCDLKIS